MSEEGASKEGTGEYVSTAPETSAIPSKGGATPKPEGPAKAGRKRSAKGSPWRDNIEAIAVSIVTIVLFKYFVLEAYRIPTGSMQPTLMGNDETGIYDRVIVDKLSYHFRDPERFEVVVFRYPLESNKNFIKRIVGMPGEDMRIEGGDLFVKPLGADASEWRVLRRPRPIQDAQLRELEANESTWARLGDAGSRWDLDGEDYGVDVTASGSGRIVYPRASSTSLDSMSGSIRDVYTDGYPDGLKDDINVRPGASGQNDVGDVRLAATVRADAGTEAVRLIVHEGRRDLVFVLPGPAAAAGEAARIEASGAALPGGEGRATSAPAFRLEAGDAVDVEVQNLNDLLELRIDGDLVASLEITPWDSDGRATVEVEVDAADDARTTLSDLRVWRDIHYVSAGQKRSEWAIPEAFYVVLGDNSQDSSDGRDWQLTGFEVLEGEDEGEVIYGNSREILRPALRSSGADRNPWRRKLDSGEEVIFFRDDLGERHVFRPDEVRRVGPVDAPFVPRDLIRGRAVLVVWPLSLKYEVSRWKWVR